MTQALRKFQQIIPVLFSGWILFSCKVQQPLARYVNKELLTDSVLKSAHLGISIFFPEGDKFLYEHQDDKYFVPASNVKIPTCYAAMKFLGDSLPGLNYVRLGNEGSRDIWIQATGDPTLLHPDFPRQPIVDFLKKDTSVTFKLVSNNQWREDALGSGWSWNDYASSYMAERSPLPVFGNLVRFYGRDSDIAMIPSMFKMMPDSLITVTGSFNSKSKKYNFTRSRDSNQFLWSNTVADLNYLEIPFVTSPALSIDLLKDTIRGLKLSQAASMSLTRPSVIYSRPTDSLLKPMMHRSDNFFAEQSLLMVSNKILGYMSDEKIIDTLLKTVYKDLPQKPRWVDGSGLSRYNLFSPKDLVFILNKIKNEFGMNRVKDIFATGDEGTLSNYYKDEKGYIYAKTGTLSGVVAISGYLYTKSKKLLIFSVLVNNHQGSATEVRRAVERFLKTARSSF